MSPSGLEPGVGRANYSLPVAWNKKRRDRERERRRKEEGEGEGVRVRVREIDR